MRNAKIGVLLDRTAAERRWSFGLNVFESYLGEILAHRGIAFEWLHSPSELDASGFDIVLVALADENAATADALWTYAEGGGHLIAYGGSLHRLAKRLGRMTAGPQGSGYTDAADFPWHQGQRPIRHLDAVPWVVDPALAGTGAGGTDLPAPTTRGFVRSGTPDGTIAGDALQQFAIGKGMLERWAVSIPATIVGLQQGTRPVLEDGVPAGDGTIPIHDGVNKADDAAEVDWRWDRATTASGAPYFAHPYADWWRELLIGHLLRAALSRGLTVPFTGYWPDGIDHVALLSLDSDHTGDEEGETVRSLLAELDVPATWCMMEKAYSRELYDRLRDEGHELALHYNAVPVDHGDWGADEFRRQAEWFRETTGQSAIASNKNHLTRVEGWGELFRFCEENGVASDQTRGGSKKGSVGYLFGTCHPYFPAAWSDERNRLYDVLEIGFQYGDFLQVDTGIIEPLLDEAKRAEGIAHFVFHPIHVHRKETIREWLRVWAAAARRNGFTFLTGERINDWERYRRSVRTAIRDDGSVELERKAGDDETGGKTPAAEFEGRTVVWVPVIGQEKHAAEASTAAGEALKLYRGIWCRRTVV